MTERLDRPEGEGGGCDPLERLPQSRLSPEIAPPLDDFDAGRAEELCAGIARGALGDFAPALLLLPGTERRRAQALLAHACALFDFARQAGLEGEKLAQINRWELALETALGGEPVGQPVVLCMARENERRRWPADALEDLAACARHRAVRRRPATAIDADLEALSLGRAVAGALLEKSLNAEVDGLASALVRLASLQRLGEEVAARRCPLPTAEVAEAPESRYDPAELLAAVGRECPRIRARLLRAPRGLVSLPHGYGPAAVFALLAGLRLITEIEDPEADLLKAPPRLALGARIGFLLRARWVGR
jgi:phytoene/squalene synthetase